MSILKESVDEGDILFLLIFTLIQFSSLILFYLLMQFSLSKSETASFFSVFKTYLSSGFVGALVTILIVVPVRYYIVSPHIIEGDVMSPALKNGDYAIFDTLTKFYQSGDIVVVKVDNSSFPDRVYLQRIIGLPNQKVEITDGKIFINDELLTEDYAQGKIVSTGEVTLGSDEYFVLVDKRTPTYKSDFMSNKIIKAKQIVGEYRFTLYNID